MLKLSAAFIFGIVIGYFSYPRPDARPEQPIQIINKIQHQPAVMCPQIVCETKAVKESLGQCLAIVSSLTAQISSLSDEKIEHQQRLQNELEESAYWKKKYTEFDCGE